MGKNIIKNRLALSFVLIVMMVSGAVAQTVTGSAPHSVEAGDRFQVTYSVDAQSKNIVLQDIDGVQILYGPSQSTSTSVSIVNGNMTREINTSYTYVLRADKEGDLILPPATVTVGDKQVRSNSLTIKVVKKTAGGNDTGKSSTDKSGNTAHDQQNDIIVVQSLNKQSAYEGEAIVLTTKVYTAVDITEISDSKVPALDNFVIQKLDDNHQIRFHLESYNGRNYQAAIFDEQVLIPQKSGKITIQPIEYEFLVRKRVRNAGGFFGGFFDDVQMVRQRARSNTLTVNIKPLPQPRPSGFSGGVGEFKLDVSVAPQELEVNNSVQVKVKVSGDGNLKIMSMPKPQVNTDFDTYDPSDKSSYKATVKGNSGYRLQENLLIARHEGEFEIPAIKFCYFSPEQGKYVTLSKGPYNLKVVKGESSVGVSGVVNVVAANGEAVTYQNVDLRYLHTQDLTLRKKGDYFVMSAEFWLLMTLPVALLIAAMLFNRKRIADNANMQAVRKRKANKVANKRLKKAAKFISKGERENFFDEVMRAMWGFLSDKLSLSLSDLTKDNAREQMAAHGISKDIAEEFIKVLEQCEFARYAPAELSDKMEDIYQRAADVMKMMTKQ